MAGGCMCVGVGGSGKGENGIEVRMRSYQEPCSAGYRSHVLFCKPQPPLKGVGALRMRVNK